jgi:transaldolase/glucose-6-phosphate isomerase
MNPIHQLQSLGQSIWYDNIQRRSLENGEFAAMIARGDIRGVTSNPSIFHNAIAKSHDYDDAILPLAWSGWDAEQIFWQLAFEDIRAAADFFLPLYTETEGADGYVSLEVSPRLAHETEATLAQARHLWQTVARPNLMIKIPATKEGLPAIRQAIAEGINVNVTLIFSIERYREVMDAYLTGLEDRLSHPPAPLSPAPPPPAPLLPPPASVASFFVSRLDTKIDKLLPEGSPLRGKAAVANSKLAYDEFRHVFGGPRFAKLQAAGCRLQRPLWASTSTKNPAYPDTIYVDNLIGPATVNTVPPQTLEAFRDHGKAGQTITADLDGARRVLFDLEAAGISMAQMTQELEEEGVQAFADAFTDLLTTIEERRRNAAAQLGPLPAAVVRQVAHLEADAVPRRLHDGDPALWTTDSQGQKVIRKRLGWLALPETSRAAIEPINDFVASVRADGFTHILLLGMGGSSLAPEVFSLVFPNPYSLISNPHSLISNPYSLISNPYSLFSILDSTDPAQILAADRAFPPEKTLYLVSSKSGDTVETIALFDYFWERAGRDGKHFVAITDPGTTLEALANARGFRATFLADPSVGGRYSALTHFGLVPAALLGIDLGRLLDRAAWMARQCAPNIPAARNPGLVLGAILAQAALAGRDKLTLIADESVAPLGAWLEQLIAESSGKLGRGILPIDGEPVTGPAGYGDDRLFVYLRSNGEHDALVSQLRAAGHPALEFLIPDPYSLFSEFYRWEVATAIACHILHVNAFDQPDVQDNKDRTKSKIAAYKQGKRLDEGNPAWEGDGVRLFAPGAMSGMSLAEILDDFLSQAQKGDYIAVNAYLPRNPEIAEALQKLRLGIRQRTGCAVTVGFGPRFLHSTGQYHKGGPDSGLFLQITADPTEDIEIPARNAPPVRPAVELRDEPIRGMTFGALQRAQALGDYEALVARGRRILRLHFTGEAPGQLAQMAAAIGHEEP